MYAQITFLKIWGLVINYTVPLSVCYRVARFFLV
jgi:hypothetical protein